MSVACHRGAFGVMLGCMKTSRIPHLRLGATWIGVVLATTLTATAQSGNVLVNGSFDYPGDPLGGWVTDYAWSKNAWYIGNKDRVSVASTESGRQQVARLESNSDEGTKMETVPIPFEAGYRYQASLKFKGPDYRIYFAGYKWRPGVRPHDSPRLADLRSVYRSKVETGSASGWKTVKLELPGKKLTPQARTYLKQVKYVTLYVYVIRTGYLDEVVITRTPDPSVRFD